MALISLALALGSAVGVLPIWKLLRFVPVAQEIGDQGAEQSVRRQAELGRLLAAADGYQVVASDGTHLGRLDHVRYQRYADHPDEIVVRRRARLPEATPRPSLQCGRDSKSARSSARDRS